MVHDDSSPSTAPAASPDEPSHHEPAGPRMADRDQDGFIATMIHELRGPAGIIHQLAEVMGDVPDIPEAALRLARSIQANAARMTRVINDLRVLAQCDSERLILQSEPVSIAAVCAELTDERASHGGPPLFRLVYSDAEVDVDATRIRQAIGNVLDNAIAYSVDGGTVRIVVERRGDDAVVTVRDTGIGIPVEDLPHVYDRFHRGSNAHGVSGSGLGLSVARSVIEAHGGDITIDSAVGTTAVIRLPIAEPAS